MSGSFEETYGLQVAAIGRYLEMMVDRRKRVRPGDSFIVFQDEDPALEDATRRKRARARTRRRVRVQTKSVLDLMVRDAGESGAGESGLSESADTEGPARLRYTQLCFMRPIFYLELPVPTLTPDEGEKLKARRSGFYWLSEQRPGFYSLKTWRGTARKWNPLVKQYINSDVQTAAEDVAYIWFHLWGYPPDWQLWYTAGAFDDRRRHDWAGSFPVRT